MNNVDYVDEGNKDGIALILVHGFPDLWYGWRHQIDFLAKLGPYRVIAVDMLGYGGTSKPRSSDPGLAYPDYSPRTVGSHLVGLMDHLGIEKSIMIGHDWGSGIVSRVGWHFPQRLHAMICIGSPLRPITKDFITLDKLVEENPMFTYFAYFCTAEAAKEMDAMLEDQVNAIFNDETGNNQRDREYYIENHKVDGFQGPLSYYKAFELSHKEDLSLLGQRLKVSTLMMIVVNDPIIPPDYARSVNTDYVDDIEFVDILKGGHFVLTENPGEVNLGIKAYLEKLFRNNKVQVNHASKISNVMIATDTTTAAAAPTDGATTDTRFEPA
ncbi:hypothetical protein BGZ94_001003, partial [Podila epigama]